MSTTARGLAVVAGTLLAILVTDAAAAATPRSEPTTSTRILLLFDENQSLPGLAVLDQSLRATLTAGLAHVEFYSESLSLSQFTDEQHEDIVSEYFRQKYRARPPHLIVAVMGPSLQFLLRHGKEVFPDVPIVFCGADPADVESATLPPTVTGLLVRRTFAPTLDLALRLHPATAHVYVVGGTSLFDRRLQAIARQQFQRFAGRVPIDYLTDLPMTELLDRVKGLPRNSLVLYLTLFRDGAGNAFVPHAAAAGLAAAANVPLYVCLDQYLGLGPVGGVVYSVASEGQRAGELALRVLRGERPATIPVSQSDATMTLFDARQLRRWGLDESRLPPGSVVRWREPSPWRDYRTTMLTVSGIGTLLLALVAGLLYERRARRRAEVRSREQLTIAAHLGRQLAMGEMASALAHELYQPLGTIRLSVAAAERMLGSGGGTPERLGEILREIDREDARASQIIQRQRAMLQKREIERSRLDLNDVVRRSLDIVAHEAASRRVRLDLQLSGAPCAVTGHQILLQQVVVNLLVNAMDAMARTRPFDRRALVKTIITRHVAEVSVQDRGEGIAETVMPRVFEPFVTTKAKGLGIGLAIVRGIVEEHGGTIQAANNPDGGATFWFTLPAIDGQFVDRAIVEPPRSAQAAG